MSEPMTVKTITCLISGKVYKVVKATVNENGWVNATCDQKVMVVFHRDNLTVKLEK